MDECVRVESQHRSCYKSFLNQAQGAFILRSQVYEHVETTTQSWFHSPGALTFVCKIVICILQAELKEAHAQIAALSNSTLHRKLNIGK